MKKRTVALLLALVLCAGCAVGGTVAYLATRTTAIVNTFTASDINITLTESANDFKMVPGNDITKDPVVTVEANSEACWLFVKLEKSTNYGTYLDNYEIAEGWTALDGETGVYYRAVAAGVSDQSFHVINGDKLTVQTTVTKADMESIKTENMPTLTVTAYAVQQANLTFTAAWDEAKNLPAPGANPNT